VGQSQRSCDPLGDSVQALAGRLDRENQACARTSQFRRATPASVKVTIAVRGYIGQDIAGGGPGATGVGS
jgi:hypothetical protein